MLRRTKIILFPALLLICIGLVMYADRNGLAGATQNSASLTDGTNAVKTSSKAERAKMSNRERLQWLEKNGQVPEDAEYMDWYLSQKTSWWGKPLDPKKFWKDRPVWNDKSAVKDAQRHGRLFPPIPTDDPRYKDSSRYMTLSDNDTVLRSGGVEVAGYDFHGTYREGFFWDDFGKTQPKPPEDLDREAEFAAKEFMSASSDSAMTGINVDVIRNQAKNDGKPLNYPPEEFADNALSWTYVVIQRKQYEHYLNVGWATNGGIIENFLQDSKVDAKLITTPLSADQFKAANAWKVSYLQRLQKEKVDKSYIDAYRQAWNLPATEVFGQSK